MSSNAMLKRRSGLVVMFLLAFILVLAVGAYLWQAVEASSLSAVQSQIGQLKPILSSLRLLLIGLIALFWPTLMNLLYRLGRIDAEGRARLFTLRWRVTTWMVVIELILGQNLLGQFFAAWQGTAL
ncbi:hypothetical protein ACFL3U_03865 [Pseudomonadota bacterium]